MRPFLWFIAFRIIGTLGAEHSGYDWFSLAAACFKAELNSQRLLYQNIWDHFVHRQPSVHLKITKTALS
ncbi:hypothetical protein [Acinetobacter sp.]|uniref:hypothetical protein n=1 Tax=Acinetobacter sp. TaxID=472 RepID=UPI0035B12FE3